MKKRDTLTRSWSADYGYHMGCLQRVFDEFAEDCLRKYNHLLNRLHKSKEAQRRNKMRYEARIDRLDRELDEAIQNKFVSRDSWNMDKSLAKILHEAVTSFKKSKRYGYPVQAGSPENWEKELDEIIWMLNELSNDYPGNNLKIFDRHECDKYSKRFNEACELFGKRLPSMWD